MKCILSDKTASTIRTVLFDLYKPLLSNEAEHLRCLLHMQNQLALFFSFPCRRATPQSFQHQHIWRAFIICHANKAVQKVSKTKITGTCNSNLKKPSKHRLKKQNQWNKHNKRKKDVKLSDILQNKTILWVLFLYSYKKSSQLKHCIHKPDTIDVGSGLHIGYSPQMLLFQTPMVFVLLFFPVSFCFCLFSIYIYVCVCVCVFKKYT